MRSRGQFLFVAIVGVWLCSGMRGLAFPRDCANVCNLPGADCNTLCYVDFTDFVDGVSASCLDYGVYDNCPPGPPTPMPGDGTAGSGQGGTCPNASCDGDETCESCPKDCADTLCGGCGDSICAADEYGGYGPGHQAPQCSPQDPWCSYCPEDCGECDPQACWPQACGDESAQYQCAACDGDEDCETYSGWCATGFGRDHQCHTYCWDSTECPYPAVCYPGFNVCGPDV